LAEAGKRFNIAVRLRPKKKLGPSTMPVAASLSWTIREKNASGERASSAFVGRIGDDGGDAQLIEQLGLAVGPGDGGGADSGRNRRNGNADRT